MIKLIEKLDILHNYGLSLDKSLIFIGGPLDSTAGMSLRIKFEMIEQYWTECLGKAVIELNIVVNSGGGDAECITSVLDFYDELKQRKILVNTHAEGICMSAATFLVAGGTGVRKASKKCRFLIHELQISNVEGTKTQVKSFQHETDFMQETCTRLYAEFSTKGKKLSKQQLSKAMQDWERLCKEEYYFGTEEALDRGLIDEIV